MSSLSYQSFWEADHPGILCKAPLGFASELCSKASTELGSSTPESSDRQPGSSSDDSADESGNFSRTTSSTGTPSCPSTPEDSSACGRHNLRDGTNYYGGDLERSRRLGRAVGPWKTSMGNVVPEDKHSLHGARPRNGAALPIAKVIKLHDYAARRPAAQGLLPEQGAELRDLEGEMAELARDLPAAPEEGAPRRGVHRRPAAPGRGPVPKVCVDDGPLSGGSALGAAWSAARPEVGAWAAGTELRDLDGEMAELAREVAISCGDARFSSDKRFGTVARGKKRTGISRVELRDLDGEISELVRDVPLAFEDSTPQVSMVDSNPEVSAARAAAAQAKALSGALAFELRDLEDEMVELTRELLSMKATLP